MSSDNCDEDNSPKAAMECGSLRLIKLSESRRSVRALHLFKDAQTETVRLQLARPFAFMRESARWAHRVFRSIYPDHETDYEGHATELRLAGNLNAVSHAVLRSKRR